MVLRDLILPEYDHEMALTRRVLERVPPGAREWRPHPKSMTLGSLAAHLAEIPRWMPTILRRDGYDMARDANGAGPIAHETTEALLAAFDRNAAAGREIIAATDDVERMEPWTLRAGGHDVFTQPRIGVLRSYILSHLVHHRGQLTVYLRMLDVALPAVYGPSADAR
jgi:uncharacterized damage-inducible protein DinB